MRLTGRLALFFMFRETHRKSREKRGLAESNGGPHAHTMENKAMIMEDSDER